MGLTPTLLDFDVEATDWDGPYELVQCKRALHPSSLGDAGYSLNPYLGCEHGCIYCFAPGYLHTDASKWRVVRVKTNIVDRLSKEIDFTEGTIGLGTVTDAYQAAEGRFRLSRLCLELLHRKKRSVYIITKSPLVLRDLDLLRDMDSTVFFTITNPDLRICRMTEPGAPSTEERLEALRTLVKNGVKTGVFIAPVLSTLEGHERELIGMIADTGVRDIFIDPFKEKGVEMDRMLRMGIGASPKAVGALKEACKEFGMNVIRSDLVPSVYQKKGRIHNDEHGSEIMNKGACHRPEYGEHG